MRYSDSHGGVYKYITLCHVAGSIVSVWSWLAGLIWAQVNRDKACNVKFAVEGGLGPESDLGFCH